MRVGLRGLRRPETHRPAPEANLFGFGVANLFGLPSAAFKIPLAKMKDSGCKRVAGAITRQIVRDTYCSIIAASGFAGQLPGRDRDSQPGNITRRIVRDRDS